MKKGPIYKETKKNKPICTHKKWQLNIWEKSIGNARRNDKNTVFGGDFSG